MSFIRLPLFFFRPSGNHSVAGLAGHVISSHKGKGKGLVLAIALLHNEHMLRSALQSWKWQLIGMS